MIYTKDNPKLVENVFRFKGIKTFTGFVKDNNLIIHYVNGKIHREDGHAIEEIYGGRKKWWLNDDRHREDGPAVEDVDEKEWWLNGKRHREDGPAYEDCGGFKSWYLNNERHGVNDEFTNESWIKFIALILLK